MGRASDERLRALLSGAEVVQAAVLASAAEFMPPLESAPEENAPAANVDEADGNAAVERTRSAMERAREVILLVSRTLQDT